MSDKRVFFLDRDGTINIAATSGYVAKETDWQWVPGAINAMKKLQEAGFSLAIITNQTGIGHGEYTEEDMRKVHLYMEKELAKEGVSISYIAYCPHRRDSDCVCRKPKTGMADQIEQNIGKIDYANSWTVGDKIADLKFGKTLGTHTALIRSSYWEKNSLEEEPDLVVNSLEEVARKVL